MKIRAKIPGNFPALRETELDKRRQIRYNKEQIITLSRVAEEQDL